MDLEGKEHLISFARDWVQAKDQQTGRAIWHGTKFYSLNKLAPVDDTPGESKLLELLGDLKRDKPLALMLSLYSTEEEIKNLFRQVGSTQASQIPTQATLGLDTLVLYLEGIPFWSNLLRRRKGR